MMLCCRRALCPNPVFWWGDSWGSWGLNPSPTMQYTYEARCGCSAFETLKWEACCVEVSMLAGISSSQNGLSFVETRSRKSCWERFCHATSREVKVIVKPTKHHLPQIHQNPQPPTSPNPQHPPTQFHYRANLLFFRSDKRWAVGWCQRAWSLEIFQSQGSPSLKTSTFQLFPKTAVNFYGESQPILSFRGVNRFQSGNTGEVLGLEHPQVPGMFR